MRLNNSRQSRNIEDRRGQRMRIGGRGGKIGLGTIVLALVAIYFGVDPSVVLQNVAGPVVTEQSVQAPAETPQTQFVSKVLADTEDAWSTVFQQTKWSSEARRVGKEWCCTFRSGGWPYNS